MADSANPPRKPCHNCRRQRLRCDRSYPHCNKCQSAGRECLGYGQLFRWTGAVASRGKLAGKTLTADGPAARSGENNGDSPGLETSDDALALAFASSHHVSGPDTVRDIDGETVELIRRLDDPAHFNLSSPVTLVDPLFQDMSQTHRFYLSHFTNRVCQDLVSHDLPDRNPFRSLLPLTRAHPLLQHIIVAASAGHMSNLLRPDYAPLPQPGSPVFSPSFGEASQRAFRDALVAKHKALKLMNMAVQHVELIGVEVVLAAALFLVNVELMESGKHGWKPHLEAAGRIIKLLGPVADEDARDLRDYIISDCAIYYVLSSAFTPATSPNNSYFESVEIPILLQRAAANSYLCCPPEILDILLAASTLSNVKTEDDESAAQTLTASMNLLERAQAFDMRAWAVDALKIPYLHDISLQSRMNAGNAHRLTACLYIVQAIPSVGAMVGPDYAIALESELFDQLSAITYEDTNFKATCWPTFIAGVGTTSPERQAWVMERLKKLLRRNPWGFLYTAMETMHTVWNLTEKEKQGRSWVQILKDPDMNILIV